MVSAAAVFPNLLTSTLNPAHSLAGLQRRFLALALQAAFIANTFGMIAVGVYSTYVHRIFHGKVSLGDHGY